MVVVLGTSSMLQRTLAPTLCTQFTARLLFIGGKNEKWRLYIHGLKSMKFFYYPYYTTNSKIMRTKVLILMKNLQLLHAERGRKFATFYHCFEGRKYPLFPTSKTPKKCTKIHLETLIYKGF